ncbi:putative tRNA-splicing endonuclease subunit tsp-4 [Pseudocercospora fuligena]|uniref:tRNA-splicing endonuclease subunit Sen34 n=1 Tax=Pseudocercospora fuligena TaxID=685502 RepID=A0A8H6RNC6_9PEZI|nr:putative tRNA-splicing endonuclease subunit tsp-4 [Pseudocercospora fuligena]
MAANQTEVTEPIPIFKVAHRFLLYDVNHVTYLRREHNISGVLTGTLPQASQQNVFLGLPLELMPEEARLLVEKDVAYVVDDTEEHKRNFLGKGLVAEERKAFQAALRKQGQAAAQDASKKADERKKAALKKIGEKTGDWNDIPDDMFEAGPRRGKKAARARPEPARAASTNGDDEDESLFASPANSFPSKTIRAPSTASTNAAEVEPYHITPTTSHPPLQATKPETSELPEVPPSYPLYRHLHQNGYFMAPGIRFGCQYMAYPGDPLRFHSHFLCNGMDWDQEFDLLDLVGGGRLGTGVKKGFLVGGKEEKSNTSNENNDVRTFCIEWGGM